MKNSEKKYNLVGNCVNGLDDPYFRNTVCSDATEMAGIVDEDMNKFLLGDDFVQSVNWSYDLMGLPSDNIYEFAYNPYKDIYWAYNIEDDVHFFFVRDSINENYKDTITVKTIKLSDILEEMLSEPEGKYVYIGTCMDSFDEYGECIHNAFYDEEHFFNSWQNANEISKEEFWSNINPLSDKYDEVKELESDPEYPAEYRYNPDDDIYFIFVGNDTHYFFVSPDSYENTKDTEEDYYDINIQENIQRIREVMGLGEIKIKKKNALGRGKERIVYRSTTNPNLVLKIGPYKMLLDDKERSEKYPDIYAKVFEVRRYNGDDYYTGVAIMERVNTKKFLSMFDRLETTLESLNINKFFMWDATQFRWNDQNFKDKFEGNYRDAIEGLEKHDTEMLDFMVKFINCLRGILGKDVHQWQFGIDKDGNIKCFDD